MCWERQREEHNFLLSRRFPPTQAAGVGFEPTGRLSAPSGFQDRPIRPLWHPARRASLAPRDAAARRARRPLPPVVSHDGRGVRGPLEPRIWLGIAVGALLASFVPYWFWLGRASLLLNAFLAAGAAAALWANIRGERRLALESIGEEERQRRATDGAPSSTNGSGTSTDPSSRW